MSKAILVIDMPESCDKCPFSFDPNGTNVFCIISQEKEKYATVIREIPYPYSGKPDWCPLRELPGEEHNDLRYDEYCDGYDDGWNGFRQKILKENIL